MKFTVIEDQWLRGEGSGPSYLLREGDQLMCCLGFMALACGYSKEEINQTSTPYDLRGLELRGEMDKLLELGHCSNICTALMTTNDATRLEDGERKEKLTKLFLDIGIEVEFIPTAP